MGGLRNQRQLQIEEVWTLEAEQMKGSTALAFLYKREFEANTLSVKKFSVAAWLL